MSFLSTLHSLRCHAWHRAVLAWFALTLLVAGAAPFIKPQVYELLCSGSGRSHLLVKTTLGESFTTGKANASTHDTLDCSLCLTGLQSAPPLQELQVAVASSVTLAFTDFSSRSAWRTAPPLPARGPPTA